MNRYQAHPKSRRRLTEGLYVVRDALVLLLAIVIIVLMAGLNR